MCHWTAQNQIQTPVSFDNSGAAAVCFTAKTGLTDRALRGCTGYKRDLGVKMDSLVRQQTIDMLQKCAVAIALHACLVIACELNPISALNMHIPCAQEGDTP